MNNVTNIDEANQQSINPDSTLNKLQLWRETKSEHKQTKIPDEIWLEIFSLEDRYNSSYLRKLFGLASKQYEDKKNNLNLSTPSPMKSKSSDDYFCEVNPSTSKQPIDIKQSYVPITTTVVVEFCRPDGRIMKIHTCTDQFKNIINDFFNG
jgi:hypothetical protein